MTWRYNMFALLRVPSLKSLAPLNPKNLISPCHYMQSKYNKNQNWKVLIKIDLHNLFGIQTVRPCEAKIWPAPSPDQNSIKFVNPLTYSNRAIRTVPYTPENVSKHYFSCPTDSAALKNCRYWLALSISFKSHCITNVFDDSNRGHWLLSRHIGGNTWGGRAHELDSAGPTGPHCL